MRLKERSVGKMNFSIIIPVYNCEEYLKQTVSSVLNQSYKNFELLLIDDGSNKPTAEICDYFSEKNNVMVFHNDNHGVAYSRNFGIDHAKNDYIIFMDSDDYWDDTDLLKKINDIANGEDFILFGYKYLRKGQLINKTIFDGCNLKSLEELTEKVLYTSSCCLKAIRRELLVDNNIYFKENLYFEDIEWNLRLAICAKSYAVLPESPYIYRVLEKSRSKNYQYAMVKDYCESIKLCVSYIDESAAEYLFPYVSYNYAILLGRICNYGDLKEEIREYKWLLNHSKNKKVKIIRLLSTIVGYNFTCKIVNWFLK